ncbi:imidazole glycerol phosphate synthase subunit HisH [Poriferisphaera sp. WC338]|uniref:imidazole glycerol phosphate synthase subunit HisH n=1 Tax=Poriferisphaera sp. WC338 TaxID=3425129 RepID=UPI003D819FDA
MIGIIDYKMGNLRSVQKAFEFVGADAVILQNVKDADKCDKLVLPGVGAFGDAMKHLDEMGWTEVVKEHATKGKVLLGICLGLQLFFDGSDEGAADGEMIEGLGLLEGKVVRFDESRGMEAGGERLKVPQMGWNAISWEREDPLFAGLSQGSHVYFVHSYFAQPNEDASEVITSARADYGGPFTASVWKDNIWAMQFHPEKSQRVGLQILKNFVSI